MAFFYISKSIILLLPVNLIEFNIVQQAILLIGIAVNYKICFKINIPVTELSLELNKADEVLRSHHSQTKTSKQNLTSMADSQADKTGQENLTAPISKDTTSRNDKSNTDLVNSETDTKNPIKKHLKSNKPSSEKIEFTDESIFREENLFSILDRIDKTTPKPPESPKTASPSDSYTQIKIDDVLHAIDANTQSNTTLNTNNTKIPEPSEKAKSIERSTKKLKFPNKNNSKIPVTENPAVKPLNKNTPKPSSENKSNPIRDSLVRESLTKKADKAEKLDNNSTVINTPLKPTYNIQDLDSLLNSIDLINTTNEKNNSVSVPEIVSEDMDNDSNNEIDTLDNNIDSNNEIDNNLNNITDYKSSSEIDTLDNNIEAISTESQNPNVEVTLENDTDYGITTNTPNIYSIENSNQTIESNNIEVTIENPDNQLTLAIGNFKDKDLEINNNVEVSLENEIPEPISKETAADINTSETRSNKVVYNNIDDIINPNDIENMVKQLITDDLVISSSSKTKNNKPANKSIEVIQDDNYNTFIEARKQMAKLKSSATFIRLKTVDVEPQNYNSTILSNKNVEDIMSKTADNNESLNEINIQKPELSAELSNVSIEEDSTPLEENPTLSADLFSEPILAQELEPVQEPATEMTLAQELEPVQELTTEITLAQELEPVQELTTEITLAQELEPVQELTTELPVELSAELSNVSIEEDSTPLEESPTLSADLFSEPILAQELEPVQEPATEMTLAQELEPVQEPATETTLAQELEPVQEPTTETTLVQKLETEEDLSQNNNLINLTESNNKISEIASESLDTIKSKIQFQNLPEKNSDTDELQKQVNNKLADDTKFHKTKAQSMSSQKIKKFFNKSKQLDEELSVKESINIEEIIAPTEILEPKTKKQSLDTINKNEISIPEKPKTESTPLAKLNNSVDGKDWDSDIDAAFAKLVPESAFREVRSNHIEPIISPEEQTLHESISAEIKSSEDLINEKFKDLTNNDPNENQVTANINSDNSTDFKEPVLNVSDEINTAVNEAFDRLIPKSALKTFTTEAKWAEISLEPAKLETPKTDNEISNIKTDLSAGKNKIKPPIINSDNDTKTIAADITVKNKSNENTIAETAIVSKEAVPEVDLDTENALNALMTDVLLATQTNNNSLTNQDISFDPNFMDSKEISNKNVAKFSDTLQNLPSLENSVENLLGTMNPTNIDKTELLKRIKSINDNKDQVKDKDIGSVVINPKAVEVETPQPVNTKVETPQTEIPLPQSLKPIAPLVNSKEFAKLTPKSQNSTTINSNPTKSLGRMLEDVETMNNIISESQDVVQKIISTESTKNSKNNSSLVNKKIISQARGEGLDEILTEINKNSGITGSLIVGHDGNIMASQLVLEDYQKMTMAVLSMGLVGNNKITCEKLELGKLQRLILNADSEAVILINMAVGILVVIATNSQTVINNIMTEIGKLINLD